MKITFQTQEVEKHQEAVKNSHQSKQGQLTKADQAGAGARGRVVYITTNEKNWLQGMGNTQGNREKSKTMTELQQETGNIDVGIRQDYMTIMANTMSQEDFAKLQEEGFDFSKMEPGEAVTIVDKIKAELARSGQHIVGYTDDLDVETLAAALGSDSLARAVSDRFQSADIPLTEENIDGVKRAWDMASQLEAPGEGASNYMIANQADPEIVEFYLAQNSGAESMTGAAPRFYAEEIQGYYTQSASAQYGDAGQTDIQEGLQNQIDKVITDAGFAVTEETRQNAKWLLDQGLPLTEENLVRLQEIQSVRFPVDEDTFARAVASAIAEGKEAIHGNLANPKNIYELAAEQTENFWKEAEALWESGGLTARRQLEEIRLRMTAEINVKLLQSGFSIDTAPMEVLIEALKKAETQLAASYFPEETQAIDKYELYRQTNQVVEELPQLPARTVGSWTLRLAEGNSGTTLLDFHAEGKALQETYEKANESYEALMTAPRKDLGDSIRKAFANVDDILEDLNLSLTEQNRRAVRILGYNRMELTVENIEKVKYTDEQVRSVVAQMTPAKTLQMIRDGINPLEMSFEELDNYFHSLSTDYQESAESYSKFLYHLEQNKEITAEEREAYIGIYRLVHQIEKSDGAAIGAVVNTGAELQFANLLSAVRTGKFRHMDVKVTNETGLMEEIIRRDNSISQQINDGIAAAKEAMAEVTSDEEVEARYRSAMLEEIRRAAGANKESLAMLDRSGLPVNVDNMLTTKSLVQEHSNPYKRWKGKAQELEEKLLSTEGVEEFTEEYQEGITELKEQIEWITVETAVSSVDVKELQLMHKQLTVMTKLSDSQEYIVPMFIGDQLGRVHLTLISSTEEKGTITIQMDWGKECHGEAHLQVNGNQVSGYLVGNRIEEVTKLQNAADIFHKSLQEDTSVAWEAGEIPVVGGSTEIHVARPENTLNKEASSTEVLYQVARRFLQAMKR